MSSLDFRTKDDTLEVKGIRHVFNCLIDTMFKDTYVIYTKGETAKQREDRFQTTLNTILLIGSNPMKLIAKIHAQCQMGCYIPLESVSFVCKTIEEGIASGLMLSDRLDWLRISAFLKKATSPIILSFSVSSVLSYYKGEYDEECDISFDGLYSLVSKRPYLRIDEKALTYQGGYFGKGETYIHGFLGDDVL